MQEVLVNDGIRFACKSVCANCSRWPKFPSQKYLGCRMEATLFCTQQLRWSGFSPRSFQNMSTSKSAKSAFFICIQGS